MDIDQLNRDIHERVVDAIDRFHNQMADRCSPTSAFAAGMLTLAAYLLANDSPDNPLVIAATKSALFRIADEQGWGIDYAPAPKPEETG